jgi:nucleoside-diphosphate-sugar epimerase
MENVQMCFNVLEFCRKTVTPLIFGSSREVYGDIHRHITDESQADFVVAESPYSASKIAGEAFIYSYAECYDLPYLVFRFSNVYGRYDCDLERMERVIPLFIRKIAHDEPIVVFGREKVLDFTYVDDCTDGVLRAVDALARREAVLGPGPDGGYYLVGLRRGFSRRARERAFLEAPMGTQDVLEHTRAALRHPVLLPPWSDVDSAADLRSLARELEADPNSAKAVSAWLGDHGIATGEVG